MKVGLELCWHVVGSPTAKHNTRQVEVGYTPTLKCDNLVLPILTNRSRIEIQTCTCVPINTTHAIFLRTYLHGSVHFAKSVVLHDGLYYEAR